MKRKIERPVKLNVRVSEEERDLYARAAYPEPTTVWVRQTLTEAAETELAERRLRQDRARAGATSEPLLDGVGDAASTPVPDLDDTNPEIPGQLSVYDAVPDPFLETEDGLLNPHCPNAAHHWQLARGATCPACGGVNR